MHKNWIVVTLALLSLAAAFFPLHPSDRSVSRSNLERRALARSEADLSEGTTQADRTLATAPAPRSSERLPSDDNHATRALHGAAGASALSVSRLQEPVAQAPQPRPVDAFERPVELDEMFSAEAQDSAWAPSAEDTIRLKLDEHPADASTLQSVECRTLLCRIEVKHEDGAAYARFLTSAFKDSATRVWAGDALSEGRPDAIAGGVVSVSYLAREGEPMPMVGD
jgi:hypothetical protein